VFERVIENKVYDVSPPNPNANDYFNTGRNSGLIDKSLPMALCHRQRYKAVEEIYHWLASEKQNSAAWRVTLR
jgi:hypothetical protein